MREIKFRAWGGKDMFYSHNNSENKDIVQLSWFFNKLRESAPLMQFTGLKDKNGVEIYEGDVLINNNKIISVDWIVYDDTQGYNIDTDDWELEVIGNIYENPELL